QGPIWACTLPEPTQATSSMKACETVISPRIFCVVTPAFAEPCCWKITCQPVSATGSGKVGVSGGRVGKEASIVASASTVGVGVGVPAAVGKRTHPPNESVPMSSMARAQMSIQEVLFCFILAISPFSLLNCRALLYMLIAQNHSNANF